MNWFWAEIEPVLCNKYITFLHRNRKSGIIWCIIHEEAQWLTTPHESLQGCIKRMRIGRPHMTFPDLVMPPARPPSNHLPPTAVKSHHPNTDYLGILCLRPATSVQWNLIWSNNQELKPSVTLTSRYVKTGRRKLTGKGKAREPPPWQGLKLN